MKTLFGYAEFKYILSIVLTESEQFYLPVPKSHSVKLNLDKLLLADIKFFYRKYSSVELNINFPVEKLMQLVFLYKS